MAKEDDAERATATTERVDTDPQVTN